MLLSTVFCTCSFVKSLPGMRSITIFLFSPGINSNLLSSIPSNFSFHPADVNSRGNSTFNSIIALWRNELPAKKRCLCNPFISPSSPPPPGTMITFRCATLLSFGTRRHSSKSFASRQIVDIARVPVS